MANTIIMTECPNCKRKLTEPRRSWTYGVFKVQAFSCDCGTKFREYTKAGKHSFILQLKKGRWRKA